MLYFDHEITVLLPSDFSEIRRIIRELERQEEEEKELAIDHGVEE